MAGIQFVMEAPQADTHRKKRARLVTSCDHCRFKKIRCNPLPDSATCETCTVAKIPCQYRDREKYFAERSRIISRASPAGRSSRSSSSSVSGSPDLSPQVSITVLDPPQRSHSSASLSPSPSDLFGPATPDVHYEFPYGEPIVAFGPLGDAPNSHTSWVTGYDPTAPETWGMDFTYSLQRKAPAPAAPTEPALPAPAHAADPGLFDPAWPERPHPALMAGFLRTYFDNFGHFFPFLAPEDALQGAGGNLSPLVATCIAALAASHSQDSRVLQRGATNTLDAYCDHAKILLAQVEWIDMLDTLHGLVLLAWAEYTRGRTLDFCTNIQKAKAMAGRLGLADGTLVQLARTPSERDVLQSTWAVVWQLSLTAESGRL